MMRVLMVWAAVFAVMGQGARAQSPERLTWVQIEAQPSLRAGLSRAEAYARTLADVNGFALGGGWYGIVLGPYTPDDAAQVLQVYRNDGLIPRDSFIALGTSLGQQFFPQGAGVPETGAPATAPSEDPAPDLPASNDPPAGDAAPQLATPVIAAPAAPGSEAPGDIPDETPAQARQSERALTAQERRDLQAALQWAGFYDATIDGAFGRGTRASMAAWQTATGYEPTGILTKAQRAVLIRQYTAILEGLDLQRVTDAQSGIEIVIPAAMVAFDRYEPPFARFNATGDGAARVLLISQPGDRSTLAALYDVMQTLEIVPLEGARALNRNSFTLIGRNAEIVSETRVALDGDEIKGFTLIWPAADEDRRSRLISEMQASFTRLPGVLDSAAGNPDDQRVDLLAGLQIRTPRLSRSGFYVDADGTVVTTSDAVEGCTRITLDKDVEAQLITLDPELGIALLDPGPTLAPSDVAQFSPAPPRLQSDVAVAGYSYEGVLDAPSMTFGTLADLRGLNGERDLHRLDLGALPGDAGGPVFDARGNVLGLLLPRGGGDRQLPQDVSFALAGSAVADVMQRAGLTPGTGDAGTARAPEDITTRALGMTVLVSCWE